ncbi:actin filament-associated protein 1-like 2 isoform X2 [Dunckerocampus dactyliophorus]|uniref:actin filament-associated protein 1-like 2 isoform X2 n=2 Tax=Dunckerocampus dactyliophorus TaxID=161453 RepID=UPI00240546F7|nr:actin filament-associated protein 1-like 2 isoform X2 [Dunckerocampus dactyliophorus]
MDKQKALAKLMWDLQSFLSVLDSENLSYIAQAQKKSISALVSSLQTPDAAVEDAEYVVMSCPSSYPGNEADAPPTGGLSESSSRPDLCVWTRDAVTTAMPRPPAGSKAAADEDEDMYEEAQPYQHDTAESDSSYYESYGEEDEDEELVKDRAHYIQWSASQPCLRPAPESRLCGYLWRRRWLGQWTKQLFIIRNHSLLCYKCARDLLPQMEASLRSCQLVYKRKSNRRIQHQLKLLLLGSHTLVLGYTSSQQAHEWRQVTHTHTHTHTEDKHEVCISHPVLVSQVIEELSVGAEEKNPSGTTSEPQWSCRSSAFVTHKEQQEPLSHRNKDKGFLNVLMNCQWQSLLCQVEAGLLNMFGEDEEEEESWRGRRPPQYTVPLRGCEVKAGPDGERSQRITLSTLGDQVAVLEVSSADEKQRWMRLLRDGAAGYHGNKARQQPGVALRDTSGPQANMYMDDPSHQPVYSNTSLLEHMVPDLSPFTFHLNPDFRLARLASRLLWCQLHSSRDARCGDPATYTNLGRHNRKWVETQRGVQKLELAARKGVPMRVGSEVNLATKQNKRSAFRQSLAVCGERAQASLLNPFLRRTASVKSSLRRSPSSLLIEHGKVFQRRKEWESKAAA